MGEVVKLPTAAPRKVRNPQTRAAFAEKAKLPRFPADRFVFPCIRETAKDARAILELQRTPELLIATAIYRALTDQDKTRVEVFASGFLDEAAGRSAYTWLRVNSGGRTVGQTADLTRAMDLIKEGRL